MIAAVMVDASRQRLELILRQVDALPALPAVVQRAIGAPADAAADACREIAADPAVAGRVLKLVRLADPAHAATLGEIVAHWGFETLRSLTLAAGVFAAFGPDAAADAAGFSVQYWRHAVAVAACAELLAGELVVNWGRDAGVLPAEAFAAGLLHDIGKPALDRTVPKSYAKVIEAVDLTRGNIADVERSILGVDHQVAGKRLAELWQLPHVLRDAIWLHGQLPQALPASVRNARLVNLVTLADTLVREQQLGYSGNYQFTVGREILVQTLGLLPEQVDDVVERLPTAIDARTDALSAVAVTPAVAASPATRFPATDPELNALSSTSAAQKRVAGDAATAATDRGVVRGRTLGIRAEYFEAVAAFQSELRPDAPPAVVLQAIAQTAAAVLGVPAAAAFSLPPGLGYAEIAVVDGHGRLVHSHLIDADTGDAALPAPRTPPATVADALPVNAFGPDLEWLAGAFSPRLQGVARFWIALEADGVCIGGVAWGGGYDERVRLVTQAAELKALASGWGLALRTCQIRDESRALSEQLAEANRRLQSAQSEVYRTRMLTSVAEIAAGAAHEMNNPLMVISGRSQLLSQILPEEKHRDAAKLIYEKSQTLSNLITALMHFAKPEPPQAALCEVAGLLRLAAEKAADIAPFGGRRVETRLNDVPPAYVDGTQIADALAEVIANAVQATDAETGRVTLSASFDAFGQRLVVTVVDNGRGMDAHTLGHAFDPFFSAKAAGRQQGMGLAKAQRWAESNSASLRIESQPGQGTRVVMILPAGLSAHQPALRPVRSASI